MNNIKLDSHNALFGTIGIRISNNQVVEAWEVIKNTKCQVKDKEKLSEVLKYMESKGYTSKI